MSLPRFSVNQSLFVNLVSVIIVIIGLICALGMNKEVFPNVNFDYVTISAVYAGAPPEDVEKLITVPIEKELKEVDGIKEIRSSSGQSMCVINVKIDPDEKNKKQVVDDIKSAVDKVNDLPKDVDEPLVSEVTSKQYPIIEVSLSGKMTEQELRDHADILEDMLEDIKGVARITKAGYREREVQVLVDPDKLNEYYVSIDEIERALAARNISMPAGKLDTADKEFSIRTTGEFLTAEEISEVIIRANDSGNWLKIKDVAKVEDSFKDEEIITRTLKTKSINLIVLKKLSGDALKIVDQVRLLGKKYLSLEENSKLQISYINDYSFFARRRLKVLSNNAWAAIFIVIGIMLLFLNKRIAVMTFLGLPIAFFATFIFMSAIGITINLISMFALIIVLGMLVDDGIIVAENVSRYVEEGMPPRQAAIKGAEEVMGAVCTAVFTTIAAFSPLLFMTGIIGQFIRAIPIVLTIALLASLGEALIILPSHLADFVKVNKDTSDNKKNSARQKPWFRGLVKWYTVLMAKAIKRKFKIFFGVASISIISIMLIGLSFQGKGPLKFILFPSSGIDYFFVRAEAPIGVPLGKTYELIKPVEDIISELPKSELDTFVTTVGQIQEDRQDPFSGQASNLVQITVYLTPEADRKRLVDEIMDDIREKIKPIKGFTEVRIEKPQTGPPVGKPVEVKIRGENFNILDKIAAKFIALLNKVKGTSDVTWDHKPGKEEIRVNIDREKATMAGLTVGQIAKTVRAVFEGGIATTIKPVKAEEETDVTVKYDKKRAENISVFNDIMVRNDRGNLIPLNKVASVKKIPGTTTIHHYNGKRVVTVSSSVDTKKTTAIKVNKLVQEKDSRIMEGYRGYSLVFGGEMEESMESLISLLKAFFYALLFIYLILASFFRSLIQPIIVLLAIPFGIIGVVFAFIIHGIPLSFMAVLGIIGLNGIVVNDSIVLVDFINKLRGQGISRRQSIIKAGQMRLRPVLLTTITTAGGLSTVAYGIGGKDPFLVPMSMAICWGLLFATVLTLIVIPCTYAIIDDISVKLTKRSSIIDTVKLKENGTGNA